MRRRVLVAGVSARAMAESAARAGWEVAAVDAFGDLDLARAAPAHLTTRDLGLPFSPALVARLAGTLPGFEAAAVAYGASFENHRRAVRALARGRELLGNAPAVLARVRDPALLARVLRRLGFASPAVRRVPPDEHDPLRRWLLKPRRSGGGHGIRRWRRGEAVPAGWLLQEEVRGTAGAIVFAADGRRARPLALSRQLVGWPAAGARGFRYAGSVLAPAGDPHFDDEPALFARAVALADAVTAEFGLVGVNGIDFVAAGGEPHVVEVNPRWSASMELAERAYGVSVFAAHAGGCRGRLPRFDLDAARRAAGAMGKAVLYARRAVVAPDTRRWLALRTMRDLPRPGERISRGRPVCTIFARGADGAGCERALARRAARVYAGLERQAARGRRRSA